MCWFLKEIPEKRPCALYLCCALMPSLGVHPFPRVPSVTHSLHFTSGSLAVSHCLGSCPFTCCSSVFCMLLCVQSWARALLLCLSHTCFFMLSLVCLPKSFSYTVTLSLFISHTVLCSGSLYFIASSKFLIHLYTTYIRYRGIHYISCLFYIVDMLNPSL